MLPPTPESIDKRIDIYLDQFTAFNARLAKHANPDVYLPLSDKIALFAIYLQQVW